jgi:hypothetical protein
VTGEAILDKGADRLMELSERAAEAGGPAASLAEPLAQDAVRLRRMSSNIAAEQIQETGQTEAESNGRPSRRLGPSPFLFIGVAFVAGVVLAKVLEWRTDVEPRG